MEFLQSFLSRHFLQKLTVASRNVGSFSRVALIAHWRSKKAARPSGQLARLTSRRLICVTVVPSSTHQPCFKITNWLPPTRLIIPASGEYCRSLQVIIILNIAYTTEIWVSAPPKSNFRQPWVSPTGGCNSRFTLDLQSYITQCMPMCAVFLPSEILDKQFTSQPNKIVNVFI